MEGSKKINYLYALPIILLLTSCIMYIYGFYFASERPYLFGTVYYNSDDVDVVLSGLLIKAGILYFAFILSGTVLFVSSVFSYLKIKSS